MPVDVRHLDCDFYAASGQKWMCGPVGSGYLYVRREAPDALDPGMADFGTVADPARPLEGEMRPGAPSASTGPEAARAHRLVGGCARRAGGRPASTKCSPPAADGAGGSPTALREGGRDRRPPGRTTLVSWEERDPEAIDRRLLGSGVVVRHLPGRALRQSIGGRLDERGRHRPPPQALA